MISLLHVMLHAGRIRLFATHVQPSTGLFWGGLVHGRTYVSSVEHTNVSNGCFYVRDKLVHVWWFSSAHIQKSPSPPLFAQVDVVLNILCNCYHGEVVYTVWFLRKSTSSYTGYKKSIKIMCGGGSGSIPINSSLLPRLDAGMMYGRWRQYCLAIVVGYSIYSLLELSDVSWWDGRMMLFFRNFGRMYVCLHIISSIVLAELQGLSTFW